MNLKRIEKINHCILLFSLLSAISIISSTETIIKDGQIELSVNSQGGLIQLERKVKDADNEIVISTKKLTIKPLSIKEIDSNSSSLNSNNFYRHQISDLSNTNFELSSTQVVEIEENPCTKISFTYDLIQNISGKLIITLYLFYESGELTYKEEELDINEGSMKLSVGIEDWYFCQTEANCKVNDTCCTNIDGNISQGQFLEVDFAVDAEVSGSTSEALQYLIGAEEENDDIFKIYLPDNMIISNTLTEVPEGYPKTTEQGFRYRIPRFNGNAVYSPLVNVSDCSFLLYSNIILSLFMFLL
mmetsp:Transcript_11533/g.11859  ORF Transcript_11533/g.11859 Transcript_11533/m.11859 type:complete len:301 (+) Transcript_11533:35-937(+)